MLIRRLEMSLVVSCWAPQQAFAAGIELTVRWYLENTDWIARISSGHYQCERLGMDTGSD